MRGGHYELPVYAPAKIAEYSFDEIAIVIPTDNIVVAENIMEQIADMNYEAIDIYTRYAIQATICFTKGTADEPGCDRLYLMERKMQEYLYRISVLEQASRLLKQMAVTAITEKTVFVYQNKKVLSRSMVKSIKEAGLNGFHVHQFRVHGFEDSFSREMIKKTSGKVISIVREPIARQISLLWHYWNIGGEDFLRRYDSFEDLESKYYSIPNVEDEFEWYGMEFLSILDINILEYPFDRDLGYAVIEKDGIELLLLKMEKINSLEKVIGQFLGTEKFKLAKVNVGEEKGCGYAYKNYLENVKIPSNFFDYYYVGNKYMDYFYTEDEKKMFCEHWRGHIVEAKP